MIGILCRMSAVIFSVVVLWLFSIVLGGQVAYHQVDDELGIDIPVPGSSIARFTEGAAVSHYGSYGLNPAVLEKWDGESPRIMLFGDSYIEAFQVPDNEKPDAILTKYLRGKTVAFGVGVSGFGFPSMTARAAAYERVMGTPTLNVFFCASGIRNDVLGDVASTKTNPVGYAETTMRSNSALKTNGARVVNRLYLNFVPVLLKKFNEICKVRKASHEVSLRCVYDEQELLINELEYILRSMRDLNGEAVIVYCPNLPRIKGGNVLTNDIDEADTVLLKETADKFSIPIIDVTSVLLEYYRENNRLPRGFNNLGGPGNGHLTPAGIEAVFKYVAAELKGRYGL